MGVAYEGYCYPDAQAAQTAIASDYHHEHNPAYTFYTGSVSGSNLVIYHYKVQGGNIILDTSVPGYTLPTCLTEGSLHSALFNPSTMSPVDIADAVGHGFVFIAVPLLVVWGCRLLLKQLFFD